MAQRLKSRLPMQKTWVRRLVLEDPWEKKMATHSSMLPGKSQGQKSMLGYSPWGHKELDMTQGLKHNKFYTLLLSFKNTNKY